MTLRLSLPVGRSRLLCFTNFQQQGVFLLLKRSVAVLQRLNAIVSRLLLGHGRIVLCRGVLSLTARLFLLLLIRRVTSRLVGRVCASLFLVIMKTFLYFLWKFSEVNLCDS